VVVVVTGAGVVVCSVVVLVLPLSDEQPVIDTRAATTKHDRINFFIRIIIVCLVTLQIHDGVIGASKAMGYYPTLSGFGEVKYFSTRFGNRRI
jgi:hypothetical protein